MDKSKLDNKSKLRELLKLPKIANNNNSNSRIIKIPHNY
jgi:hypothetical protein